MQGNNDFTNCLKISSSASLWIRWCMMVKNLCHRELCWKWVCTFTAKQISFSHRSSEILLFYRRLNVSRKNNSHCKHWYIDDHWLYWLITLIIGLCWLIVQNYWRAVWSYRFYWLIPYLIDWLFLYRILCQTLLLR